MTTTRCEYCHAKSHTKQTCSSYLRRTGRWSAQQWKALDELGRLESDALRYGLEMKDMPEAVEALAQLGLRYEMGEQT